MTPTLPAQFLRQTLIAGMERGIDVEKALRAAGLSEIHSTTAGYRLDPDQLTRVVRALWRDTNDELLGLGPQPVPLGTLRMGGLTVIHTQDLRAALRRAAEFISLAAGIKVSITEEDSVTVVEPLDPEQRRLDPLVSFAILSATHRFGAWLINRPLPLLKVELPYAAPHLDRDYELILGVSPTFGAQRAAVCFASSMMSSPVARTEEDLKQFIRHAPGNLLLEPNPVATTAGRVRAIISRRTARAPAQEVASRLSMSTTHLRRLLQSEGTSLRRLQDEVLRDRAFASLIDGAETVDRLAVRLGYSDARAFRRAFQRWTGVTPSDFRTQHHGRAHDQPASET